MTRRAWLSTFNDPESALIQLGLRVELLLAAADPLNVHDDDYHARLGVVEAGLDDLLENVRAVSDWAFEHWALKDAT